MAINKMGLENDIEYVLLSEEKLKQRVNELGEQLTKDYKDKNPLMVCVLKGAVTFYADLCRSMHDYMEMDFMAISSYGNEMKHTGIVRLIKDIDKSITGRDVIIVEDIMDSGLTLNYMTNLLRTRNPASLKIVCLLDKPQRRECAITPDYVGFVIPDEFVVGYGLDYAGVYRNLPYIGVLKPEVYTDAGKK